MVVVFSWPHPHSVMSGMGTCRPLCILLFQRPPAENANKCCFRFTKEQLGETSTVVKGPTWDIDRCCEGFEDANRVSLVSQRTPFYIRSEFSTAGPKRHGEWRWLESRWGSSTQSKSGPPRGKQGPHGTLHYADFLRAEKWRNAQRGSLSSTYNLPTVAAFHWESMNSPKGTRTEAGAPTAWLEKKRSLYFP